MFEYKNENIRHAATRDEMFKEESLILQKQTFDILVEIRDLLKPKTVEEVNSELTLTKTPTASKVKTKKEVKK